MLLVVRQLGSQSGVHLGGEVVGHEHHHQHGDQRVNDSHNPRADQGNPQGGDIDPLEPPVHASSNRYPEPRTVTIWIPVFGSLARSRLI